MVHYGDPTGSSLFPEGEQLQLIQQTRKPPSMFSKIDLARLNI